MRNISQYVLDQIERSVKRPAIFFSGEFKTETVYLWSGMGNIDWNGRTWLGVGTLAKVSEIKETADVASNGISVSLSGITDEYVSLVLSEVSQGKTCSVWFNFLDDDGSVVGDSDATFAGLLDVPTIEDTGTTATITISYENRLRDLEHPRIHYRTHEDQLNAFPGDLAFEYVAGIQEINITWGRA